jgi:hypothetical protein
VKKYDVPMLRLQLFLFGLLRWLVELFAHHLWLSVLRFEQALGKKKNTE